MTGDDRQCVSIYCDGSCLGNPGPGGYAAIISTNQSIFDEIIKGNQTNTTNNRMELQAAISALLHIAETQSCPTKISISTDSQYVKKGVTEWMSRWKLNGWRTANRMEVKNKDLWMELDHILHNRLQQSAIVWNWIKGHSGHPYNEYVDKIARQQAELIKL